MNVEEFKAYLAIDKNQLDEELIQQPSLMYAVSEAYIIAAAERDAVKEQLAAVDADLDGRLRKELERKLEKVTEAMIKNGIQVHKEHVAAFEAFADAKNKADRIGALKDSFKDRSYMLRELCGLYATNYFEKHAVRDTKATTDTKYNKQRERLSDARQERHRERVRS